MRSFAVVLSFASVFTLAAFAAVSVERSMSGTVRRELR